MSASVLDFIDNFSFILEKSCKRALLSLSIVNTCSTFNFINQILQEQFKALFNMRFLILSGLIKKDEFEDQQSEVGLKLYKIAYQFEVSDKCGFFKGSENLST